MIIENNVVFAEGKKTLYIKSLDLYSDICSLGTRIGFVNDQKVVTEIKEEDIIEGYIITIDNIQYFVDANSYGNLITSLIRQKYSLDDELAIAANARIGKTSGEEEFQIWRQKCKEAAKQIYDE